MKMKKKNNFKFDNIVDNLFCFNYYYENFEIFNFKIKNLFRIVYY